MLQPHRRQPGGQQEPDGDQRTVGEVIDLEIWLARERQRRDADREQSARTIAATLEEAAGFQAMFLHDRRISHRWGDGEIPHLAVAPSGVWVVTAKPYDGHRVDVAWATGVDASERERLLVGGRDKTILVKALDTQFHAVSQALSPLGVPVGGMLCFLGARLPRVVAPTIHGYVVGDEDVTGAHLRADGPLDADARQQVLEVLERTFPPA
ncbi:MAG: nuclease-related domain-containing protein [Nocardioidaceae bacterium]